MNLSRILSALAGYRVAVQWDGRTIVHRAASFADALAWTRCYPADAGATVTRRGRILAVRPAI